MTDSKNASDTCVAQITVVDDKPPRAYAKDITVQLDENGIASITAADVNDNSPDDGCGIASRTIDKDTFTCSDVGPNTVIFTVTDNPGNSSTATATVTVEDKVPPVALTKNITVQLDAEGKASITAADIDNGSNDACGIASLALDTTEFTCADVGSNTVTLTVTDNHGNSSTATANVTVEDNVPPVALTKNITVQLDADGSASISAADIDNGSNDACGIASLAVDKTAFTCDDVGNNTVTLTVTDNHGNSSSKTATVTVEDKVPPVALTKNITVQLDAEGNASIIAADIDNGSNDACGIASLTVDKTEFTCADVGSNTVTLTVTDNHGNSSTATATVTVEDKVQPVALTKNITVQLDAEGKASITAADIDNGSNDACGIASLSVDPSSFTCGDLGGNEVTLTVTDDGGNSSTATATVTVEDNIAPTIDTNAPATIIPPDTPISFTATAQDNCSVAEVKITDYSCYKTKKNGSRQSKINGGCAVSLSGDTVTIEHSGGVNKNFIWTVLSTDQSGNTTTAEGHVLVANPGKGKGKSKGKKK